MSEEKETVLRNTGRIDDLLNHIQQEIHLNTIILTKVKDGAYKKFITFKTLQMQEIKKNLQEELSEYIKSLKKEELV